MEVTLGSKWVDSNFKVFEVTGLEKDKTETWVKYSSGDKSYSCLVDAFLARFFVIPN